MILKQWVMNRLEERSTFDGVIMVVAGAAIILFSPFTKLIAYAAIAYGAWTMWRKD